jgi:L-alanine-DL-glutamate epimerase-like enolase superfamily enzyme
VGTAVDRVLLARTRLGDEAELYVDANGGYIIGQARRVARRLEQQDVRWFEEPVSGDDPAGLAVAAAANRDVSAHCAPNLSAHVAVATQNLRHLEWFADHDRIEGEFFAGAPDPAGGTVTPDPTAPGHGLALRHPDVERYAV